eukprot:COSAG06_NODE_4585_length_4125_cov_57.362146_6_plen_179_part_00
MAGPEVFLKCGAGPHQSAVASILQYTIMSCHVMSCHPPLPSAPPSPSSSSTLPPRRHAMRTGTAASRIRTLSEEHPARQRARYQQHRILASKRKLGALSAGPKCHHDRALFWRPRLGPRAEPREAAGRVARTGNPKQYARFRTRTTGTWPLRHNRNRRTILCCGRKNKKFYHAGAKRQ